MAAIDPHDDLLDRCRRWQDYPVNLLRPKLLKRELKSYTNYLNSNQTRLFDETEEELSFLELRDGEKVYRATSVSVNTCTKIQGLLNRNQYDPRSRHVFIHAGDSRAPLNCSRDSLMYLLAFHQASPSFLDYLFSFGDTDFPLDYSMTGFQTEDTLRMPMDQALNIQKLGRSGHDIRMSYMLRSIEQSEDIDDDDDNKFAEKEWPWRIRQTAVYHSFDVVNDRAFWINVKANKVIEERITDAVSEVPALTASSPGCEAGFAASLATHLVILRCCNENWRQCINDIETEIRVILTKAKTVNIDHGPDLTSGKGAVAQIVSRKGTFAPKAVSRSGTVISSIRTGAGSVFSRAQTMLSRGQHDDKSNSTPEKFDFIGHFKDKILGDPEKDSEAADQQLKRFMTLDMFSFGELQKLHIIGERLEEMRLVIELDLQVLRDVREYYTSVIDRDGFPESLRNACSHDVADFAQSVERLEKSLDMRKTQLESMLSWLRDGRTLFDGILQYRSVQVGRIFAESAHNQAEKMEKIAQKTEQETISMHIITFVTLAFLPGTFVATFFQSGLFEWVTTDSGEKKWNFNGEGFALFLEISCPMMGIVFLLWLWFRWWLGRRTRRQPGVGEA